MRLIESRIFSEDSRPEKDSLWDSARDFWNKLLQSSSLKNLPEWTDGSLFP
jgi:hypothetical protein